MAITKKPNVPTVFTPSAADPSKYTPVTKERIPFVQIPTAQIVKPTGEVDGESLARILTQMQQNMADATAAHRSSPLNNHVVVQQVTIQPAGTLGTKAIATIRHGLGTPFTGFHAIRVYPRYKDTSGNYQDSFPFNAQETRSQTNPNIYNVDANGTPQDPSQYLCLISKEGGMFDLVIYA